MAEERIEPWLTVSDGYELNALFVALMAAKFHPNPISPELQGSPLIARLCERTAEAVAAWMVSKGWSDQAEQMRAIYRREPESSTLELVRQRVRECTPWGKWSDEERGYYVRLLLSPYLPDEALVRRLVAERAV